MINSFPALTSAYNPPQLFLISWVYRLSLTSEPRHPWMTCIVKLGTVLQKHSFRIRGIFQWQLCHTARSFDVMLVTGFTHRRMESMSYRAHHIKRCFLKNLQYLTVREPRPSLSQVCAEETASPLEILTVRALLPGSEISLEAFCPLHTLCTTDFENFG